MKSIFNNIANEKCPNCGGDLTSEMPFVSEEEYMEIIVACSACRWSAMVKANVIAMEVICHE